MKNPTAKLRPAVTAALALSMAVPAPMVHAAELETLQAPDAAPEEGAAADVAPEPPADAPPATDAAGAVDGAGTASAPSDGAVVGATEAGPADSAATTSAEGSDPAGEGAAISEEPASEAAPLAEGDVAVDEASFPDAAFRAWVLDSANLHGAGADGVLTREEREAVSGILVQRRGIRDITGIELFPNLTFIDFEGNYIEQVDLSGNPKLQTVYLRNNCLTSIDFSHNTDLRFIEIFDNRLTEIDLTMLPKLRFVHLDYNDLKVIDLSRNTALEADGFVGNNNPLEKVILPKIEGRSFDSFVISELDEYEGYTSTLPEWYTTPDFQPGTGITPSTVADRTFIPFDGQTLYVKRTPNAYTVRFDANGGEGEMEPVARTWDDGAQALPAAAFGRLGYRFRGWAAEPGGGAVFSDGQEVANIGGADDTGETVTLYAVWEPIAASSGYFRSQLSEGERALYDDVVSQLGELTDPGDPGALEVFAPDGLDRSLSRVLFAALRDHPEYFWIDFASLSWEEVSASRFALAPRVSGESYFVDGFTADNLAGYRERFEAQVEAIVAGAPADPVLAVRYFNSWLAANNVYNPSGLGASNFSRTAASGLLSGNDAATGPVCYGYATAMKVLLDRAGIENAYVEGWAYNGRNGSGEQHAWNYVAVDGAWYAVDPTWNDPSSASAPALETYLLVGSGTVTTPSLTGRETFGANHDPSRSPAATYGLGYPALSAEACPGVSTGLVEVVGAAGSARYGTLDEALAAAAAGDTVRLWGDIELSGTAVVSRDAVIDLNGHGVRCASAPALRVEAGAALSLVNSAGVQSTVWSGAGAAAENAGSLTIGPWVCVRGMGLSAVLGGEPQAGARAYLVRTSGAWTAYEVEAPAAPEAGEADVADAGGTVEGLTALVNGALEPEVAFTYLAAPGVSVAVPASAVPAITWELAQAPEGAGENLVRGTYLFRAEAFGHELTYTVEVADSALDQAVAEGRERLEGIMGALERDASDGLVTSYDLEGARTVFAEALRHLDAAESAEAVQATVDGAAAALEATPTVAGRALELEAAWRAAHAGALALVYDGSVTLETASERLAAAEAAIAAAGTDALSAQLPEGMGEADRALVAAAARAQIEAASDGLEGLRALAGAATWAAGARDAVAALPDPVTAAELDGLQALVDALDALDPAVRRLVSSLDAARVAALRDEALAASEGDGELPGDGGETPGQPGGGGEVPGEPDSGEEVPGNPGEGGETPGGPGEGPQVPGGSGEDGGQPGGAQDGAVRVSAPADGTSTGSGDGASAASGDAPAADAAAASDAAGAAEPLAASAEARSVDAVTGATEDAGFPAPVGILAGAAAIVAAVGAAVGIRRRK